MNDEGTTNPRYEVDSPPSDFNFDTMLPGRVFTMAGEEYLYLEQQGANHMIMRHDPIRNTSFNEQPQVLSEWFSGLNAEVQAMVQPVLIPDPAPSLPMASITWADGQDGWLPANLASFPAAAADVTTVNPSGTAQAFALSFADVVHLSTETGPFPNFAQRQGARASFWWLRSPDVPHHAWALSWTHPGRLSSRSGVNNSYSIGGVRPAIIIGQ
jgi:hypothetical protein